jgi:hypothetical protein
VLGVLTPLSDHVPTAPAVVDDVVLNVSVPSVTTISTPPSGVPFAATTMPLTEPLAGSSWTSSFTRDPSDGGVTTNDCESNPAFAKCSS